MILQEAWDHANQRVFLHLPMSDWTVRFDRARHRAGACDYSRGEIVLSMPFAQHYNRYEFDQVVLHEIAHALVGPDKGHGREWKRQADKLGYDGGVKVENLPAPAAPGWKVAGFLLAMAYTLGTVVHPALGWILAGLVFAGSLASFWASYGPVPARYSPPIIKNKRNLK